MMRNAIRRILVAVDPSKPRDAAFDQALVLAHRWGAELYLVHARSPRPVSRVSSLDEKGDATGRGAERSQLRSLVRSAEEEGVRAHVVTAAGADQAGAIAAHAQLLTADLIVVPRDFGSSRIARVPRVAATIGRSAPVPVLIVPPHKTAGHRAGPPFKKIVVAVDFTVASALALRVTTDLIANGDAGATAVHALSYPSPMAFSGGEAFYVVDDLKGRIEQARHRLRGVVPTTTRGVVKPRVMAGAAHRAILDVAAEIEADLVVMGVPTRSRLSELFFGSTFRKVISQSLRPILAVPVAAGSYRWTGEPSAQVLTARDLQVA